MEIETKTEFLPTWSNGVGRLPDQDSPASLQLDRDGVSLKYAIRINGRSVLPGKDVGARFEILAR